MRTSTATATENRAQKQTETGLDTLFPGVIWLEIPAHRCRCVKKITRNYKTYDGGETLDPNPEKGLRPIGGSGSSTRCFNQRWYDPEIGRFLSNDPAKQGMNPNVYCANNPLTYLDPDGEFWWLIPSIINWAIPALTNAEIAGLQAGAINAGINAGVQLAFTGQINWQGVGNAFGQGFMSGAMSFGVGEIGNALKGMGVSFQPTTTPFSSIGGGEAKICICPLNRINLLTNRGLLVNSFITVLRQLLVLYDRFNMDISVIVSFIGYALLFSLSFLIPAGILHELYEIACLLFTGFTFNRVRLFLQTSAEEKFIKGFYKPEDVMRKMAEEMVKIDSIKQLATNLSKRLLFFIQPTYTMFFSKQQLSLALKNGWVA